jgi:hypothetical protein
MKINEVGDGDEEQKREKNKRNIYLMVVHYYIR